MTSSKSASDDHGLTFCMIGKTDFRTTINGVELTFIPGSLALPPELAKYLQTEEKIRATAKLLAGCRSFLRQFADIAEPPQKEILRGRADQHLREKVPTRVFNEAYQEVFKRPRGRPRTARK
jgi:hypothetical protein